MLCNYILDLGDIDNIMPLKVAHILKLNYIECEDSCFQIDSLDVNIVDKFKDIIINVSAFPSKKIIMSILVVYISIAYGMLLRRIFRATMGGMISLDWFFT